MQFCPHECDEEGFGSVAEVGGIIMKEWRFNTKELLVGCDKYGRLLSYNFFF